MTNHERMTRTLIVCFVILVVALVPLRLMEINQTGMGVRVLGEETVGEIQLPNADLNP